MREQLAVDHQLLPVTLQYVRVLLLQPGGNLGQRVDVLEVVEQIEGALAGPEVLEGVIDQLHCVYLELLLALDESVEEPAPDLVVLLAEEVLLCRAEGHDQFLHFER